MSRLGEAVPELRDWWRGRLTEHYRDLHETRRWEFLITDRLRIPLTPWRRV